MQCVLPALTLYQSRPEAQDFTHPSFPQITYRRAAGGCPVPTLRSTGIRVQTIVVANNHWGLLPEQIAAEYGVSKAQVKLNDWRER